MIRQKVSKLKGMADVLFCIDFSGSMTDCIEGVKNNINTFVTSIENCSKNTIIDWQIAFLAYSDDTFFVKDFIKITREFSTDLGKINTMGNEFTPGAIDYAISSFNWRKLSNKFVLVFTDEPLPGGGTSLEGDGSSKFPELISKIESARIRLFYFGPKCSYYNQFEKISRCSATYLEAGNFSSINFSSLLSSLGKTVSQSCNQQGFEIKSSNLIYDLSNFK